MSNYFLVVGKKLEYDTLEKLEAAINHRFQPGQEESFAIIKGHELSVDTVQQMVTQQVPVRFLKVKE
jgi:hypothetical protein